MNRKDYWREQLASIKVKIPEGPFPRAQCECGYEFERIDDNRFSSINHNLREKNKKYDPFSPLPCITILDGAARTYAPPTFHLDDKKWHCRGAL